MPRTLGYIITNNKINNRRKYISVVGETEEVDGNLPKLYIGYKNAKKHIPNFNIFMKKYPNNVFWTFSETEKREEFEIDVENFNNFIITDITKNIKYKYCNILLLSREEIKNIISVLNSKKRKYLYFENNMLYLWYKNEIIGISLLIAEYIGYNPNKIIEKIKRNKFNIFLTEEDNFVWKIKRETNCDRYLIPFFAEIY